MNFFIVIHEIKSSAKKGESFFNFKKKSMT
jgi:hypothetical protein